MKQNKLSFYMVNALMLTISSTSLNATDIPFRLGLENISDAFIQKIKQARIALITNQTGKDQQGRRNIDVLLTKKLKLKAILVPEHGLTGEVPAGQEVLNTIDKKTGIPVISLYKQDTGKKITPDMIKNFDILIFDIQDCGMRHYTYISTLFESLKAASQNNKEYIILDRPNPLGPLMEGPLVDAPLQSFVSIAPIPLRHAMTVGELGKFFNKYILEKPAKLHVINMKGYKRTDGLKKIPFTKLSPNIANLAACYGYSFLGLASSINPLDVGLNAPEAFKIILLPEKRSLSKSQWSILQKLLLKHGVASTPYKRYHGKNKESYTGLQLVVKDINIIHSFTLALDLIEFFKKTGLELSFAPIFDKLTGTKAVRLYLQGTLNRKQLAEKINTNLNKFLAQVKPLLMYEPLPQPVLFV